MEDTPASGLPVAIFASAEVLYSPSNNHRSDHYDRKAVRHTTTRKRRGAQRGGRGKVARLR